MLGPVDGVERCLVLLLDGVGLVHELLEVRRSRQNDPHLRSLRRLIVALHLDWLHYRLL